MVRFSGGWVGLWMGGSTGDGRIDGGGFCYVKLVVGGSACEWVPKDGSTMGGLAAAVGCGGLVGSSGCVLIFFFFFFFLVVVATTIFLVVVFIYLFIR